MAEQNTPNQASNIIAEQTATTGTKRADGDIGANMEANDEALKDRLDNVDEVKGPKRADQNSGGRVMVGETGDLHDLAAKRHG